MLLRKATGPFVGTVPDPLNTYRLTLCVAHILLSHAACSLHTHSMYGTLNFQGKGREPLDGSIHAKDLQYCVGSSDVAGKSCGLLPWFHSIDRTPMVVSMLSLRCFFTAKVTHPENKTSCSTPLWACRGNGITTICRSAQRFKVLWCSPHSRLQDP